VAVVSESMARTLWPGRDAIGECFRMARPDAPCLTVVGIAEDMVQREIEGGTRFHFYMPIEQFTRTWGNGMLLKLRGDPAEQGERVRAALQRVMPGASYVTMRPLEGILDSARRSWELGATMFGLFGALALVVAAVGLYGVIAYNVAQRANELGVRVALGAQRAHLLRLVVGESVRFTLAGVGVGLLVAAASGRWVQPLLFEQSARDPVVFGAVGLLMLVVALVASALPALKASRTDPATALRAE
jgi:ABC-type antimicrobial peptide transport system permease subunit